MHIMFISLLFSITLSNVLHTMDREDQQAITLSLDGSSDASTMEAFNISSETKNIKTLIDMKLLAEQVSDRLQTRSGKRASLLEISDIEIPNDVTIDLQVFDEWTRLRGLITGPDSGCFKRAFFCRRGGKSQFEHLSKETCQEWGKKIIIILCSQQDDPTDVVRGGKPEDLDDITKSNDEKIKSLEDKLRMGKFLATFNQNILNFIGEEQKIEDRGDEYKKLAYACLFAFGTFLGGMYGVC